MHQRSIKFQIFINGTKKLGIKEIRYPKALIIDKQLMMFIKIENTTTLHKKYLYSEFFWSTNTCEEIHILESCSVSTNKVFDIQLQRNSFLQFTIKYTLSPLFVIVL